MLDFAPRTIINGALMRNFISQPVSIMVHVEQEAEKYCKSFQAKTTDNLTIDVVLNDPLNTNIKGWIEVIGVPSGPDTIRSKEVSVQWISVWYEIAWSIFFLSSLKLIVIFCYR